MIQNLNSAEPPQTPIIFIHGNNSGGKCNVGWETWYSTQYVSAMEKILTGHYRGYQFGLKSNEEIAWNCDIYTELMSMPDKKRIYNFSYYHPDGEEGVISLSEDSVKVYVYFDNNNIKRVSLPFMPDYPPSNYHHIEWWPRYLPQDGDLTYYYSYSYQYRYNWKKGKYAKRLAEFIDKVLQATGAQKVDIVAHSMGGLVARVAIKNYGCSSKVRKLLMIGTPNHNIDYPDWLEELF
ncbi:MAG: alpha/beta fold hydrolase [candidate division WOR-3 bacterium]